MEVKISGIKCDHCNFQDMSVEFSSYPEFINKPCPICKTNLLTEEDYQKCLKVYKISVTINSIAKVMRWLNPYHYYYLVFNKEREYQYVTVNFKNK